MSEGVVRADSSPVPVSPVGVVGGLYHRVRLPGGHSRQHWVVVSNTKLSLVLLSRYLSRVVQWPLTWVSLSGSEKEYTEDVGSAVYRDYDEYTVYSNMHLPNCYLFKILTFSFLYI